jgi:DNA-3-methyladenine glycosylase II
MQTSILGPYDLARQSEFFGGWVRAAGQGIVMAFPVEGWKHSAAVVLRQRGGKIEGEVYGGSDAAWSQALAVLSLDADGTGYPAVGERDPVIGALQREHAFLRPVLFHSPYEAACAFIIGHRLRIAQGRAIRARMARDHGEAFEVAGTTVHAFPAPQRLRELTTVPGVNDEKIARLHGVADAAMDGLLDRSRLRAMPAGDAQAEVRNLRGVGAFFAAGIVLRGAGRVDAVSGDEMTRAGVRRLYQAADDDVESITEGWRPYRMWCSVLIHSFERRARAGAVESAAAVRHRGGGQSSAS